MISLVPLVRNAKEKGWREDPELSGVIPFLCFNKEPQGKGREMDPVLPGWEYIDSMLEGGSGAFRSDFLIVFKKET